MQMARRNYIRAPTKRLIPTTWHLKEATMLKSYRSFTVMLLILVVAEAAFCAPKVRIMPPDRSSFAVGQWFDIRVEASGITGDSYEFKVEINGQPVDAISWARPEFTSTGAGRREVTLRRVSFDKPLQGSISATVKDSTGEASAVSTFRVVDVSGPAPKVKNVILMIGDGFGLAHRTAARIVSRGLREGRYNAPLEVDDMDAHGYTSTSSMDSLVTDSANGALLLPEVTKPKTAPCACGRTIPRTQPTTRGSKTSSLTSRGHAD
jgi:alkaline phosphatase